MGSPHSGDWNRRRRRRGRGGEKDVRNGESGAAGSNSLDATHGAGYRFPSKQALTAGSLALTGDTIAQLRDRWVRSKDVLPKHPQLQDVAGVLLSEHDWLRALRMTSYGFLLYGPATFSWYKYLDHCMPKPSAQNLFMKVLLNQVVLGPCVIAVVFAWNNLWLGKLSELPNKYRRDALPTLLFGFRFWIPVSVLNFWAVPLQARVAFMSMASIFWNCCLSATMNKK
ncbi:unnamed protein product [Cuscuta campestris]|uniref:Protein Mpv17 n=1 Tax=Cuscuta campestris TaxID=132261 RepID=A0A484K032_9ASTE|nr:unnamed protein product [Cuscuta campestris]